ncbi:hypothetical protein [Streptomyces cylindrosporus]|uniref:Uncharacterized protein n=1 Tax=Streptomyces cylindrosporus TaxID=2927583 RepID=A0ABS9YK30_9ACTN|nr:hypothetical protein [Streptomyces cylindrosporus]MCI3277578.1 hypothetical protein [Streptomyces cylindrosporus]
MPGQPPDDLTDTQKAYNVAHSEMFQLAAYGHHKYHPSGEALTAEGKRQQADYNDRIEEARDGLEAALLRLVAEHVETYHRRQDVPTGWLRALADDPAELSLLAVTPEELEEAGLHLVEPAAPPAVGVLRDRVVKTLAPMAVVGGSPPQMVVPLLEAGSARTPRIVAWQPLDVLVERLLAAVVSGVDGSLRDRIAALHQPVAGEGDTRWCQTCSQEERQPDPVGWWVPWPCPTMQAVSGASAVDVPPPALTEEGRLRAQVEVLTQDNERDRGLAKVGARCMREGHQGLIEQGRSVIGGWRFALSLALRLDTETASWEEIHRKVNELAAEAPQPDTETQPASCAHCGKPIRRITGTLAAWWVHDPGGNTVCFPEQAASSPRAMPTTHTVPVQPAAADTGEETETSLGQLENAAIEAHAALGALCCDLDDPGSNALGALYLLSQATSGISAQPDDAARALARYEAQVMRRCADFVRDAYEEAWADDVAATLEHGADRVEHGGPVDGTGAENVTGPAT